MESSHDSEPGLHADLYREHMDTVILKSTLYDYENLLLNDGCTGMAALNPNGPMEVQFDEHKLLFVYAHDLQPFEQILLQYGLKRDDTLKFISEAEHLHSTDDEYHENSRKSSTGWASIAEARDACATRASTRGGASSGCLTPCLFHRETRFLRVVVRGRPATPRI